MLDNLNDTIGSLIDNNTHWWDVDKVRALFNPNVAADILKITIGPINYADKWS